MNEGCVVLSNNTLREKFNEQSIRIKSLQNENNQLKRMLDEFNDVIKVNEETKANIEKTIKEIYKKIETKKQKEYLLQQYSFSFSFDSLYDNKYVEQSLSSIEKEYKMLLNNFNKMVLKYSVLFNEYSKNIVFNLKTPKGLNSQSNELMTNEKKTEDTNQTKENYNKRNIDNMCGGLCSIISVNDQTEPIPSIVKCLKKINQ